MCQWHVCVHSTTSKYLLGFSLRVLPMRVADFTLRFSFERGRDGARSQ